MVQPEPDVAGRSVFAIVTCSDHDESVVADCDDGFLKSLGYDRDSVEETLLDDLVVDAPDLSGLDDGDGRFLGRRTLVGADGGGIEAVAFATRSADGDLQIFFLDPAAMAHECGIDAGREHVMAAVERIDGANSGSAVAEAVVGGATDVLDAPACCYLARDRLELAVCSPGLADGPVESVAVGEGPVGEAFQAGVRVGIEDDGRIEAAGLDPATHGGLVCFPLDDNGILVVATDEDDLPGFARVERITSRAAEKLDRFGVFEDLGATKRRLLGLMSTVPGAVYRCEPNPARSMSFVTPDVEALTGYDRQAFLDGDVSWEADLVHPADVEGLFAEIESRVGDLEPYQATYRIVTAGGQERWIWDHGAGVYEDGELVGLQGFITDVTERERHKQRLEVLNRVLRHNLRNNMNVIMGYAETLMDELAGDVPRTHANYIMEEARELTELGDKARAIEQALDFEETAPDAIDIHETVGSKVEDFARRYPEADIRTHLPDGPLQGPPSVDYALENIVENAIVHNDTDEPTVEVFVYTVEDDGNEWAEIIVADDGPGIPDHEVQALLEGGETPLRHGSGLGLWLVNWIVKRSGGELRFDENEPRGSVVTMRFPK